MTLAEYLSTKQMTDEAFGTLVGLSQPQVNRLRRGKSKPGWDVLRRISDATDGLVTANDFMSAADEAAA